MVISSGWCARRVIKSCVFTSKGGGFFAQASSNELLRLASNQPIIRNHCFTDDAKEVFVARYGCILGIIARDVVLLGYPLLRADIAKMIDNELLKVVPDSRIILQRSGAKRFVAATSLLIVWREPGNSFAY